MTDSPSTFIAISHLPNWFIGITHRGKCLCIRLELWLPLVIHCQKTVTPRVSLSVKRKKTISGFFPQLFLCMRFLKPLVDTTKKASLRKFRVRMEIWGKNAQCWGQEKSCFRLFICTVMYGDMVIVIRWLKVQIPSFFGPATWNTVDSFTNPYSADFW